MGSFGGDLDDPSASELMHQDPVLKPNHRAGMLITPLEVGVDGRDEARPQVWTGPQAAPRVDANVRAGLLDLVGHAQREGGWSIRRAAALSLGVDHARVLRWAARAVLDRLDEVSHSRCQPPR